MDFYLVSGGLFSIIPIQNTLLRKPYKNPTKQWVDQATTKLRNISKVALLNYAPPENYMKIYKRIQLSSFVLNWLPTNEATLFQFRGIVTNVYRIYSGQRAYLYVIVLLLNCKISDILPVINGAQGGLIL